MLKPNCNRIVDWNSMLNKVDARIGNWCNRWLTLGGRLILIKSVMESLIVYWISLDSIPNGIFDKI